MFDDELASIRSLGAEELRRMYDERDIEPE
jgi:hypothetical protein